MTICLLYTGKTFQSFIAEGCAEFENRLKRYHKVEVILIPDDKKNSKLDPKTLKKAEAISQLKVLKPDDYVILLDERGQQHSSVEFAHKFQSLLNRGVKRLVFVVGGAYGFDESLYQRAQEKLSFSRFTLSHQMIRLFLTEQLYRACTILNNEPYHNE